MRELTTVADEFRAGRIGVSQVREIARLAANPRAGDLVADSEDILLEAAQSLEWADFRVVTKRWEQLADADGAHAEHEHAHDDRNARCEFDGAVFRFETAHGVVQGTSMRNVFDAFCDAEFDRDWAWVKDTYGDEANASQLPRTAHSGEPMRSWRWCSLPRPRAPATARRSMRPSTSSAISTSSSSGSSQR